ncbi:MAG: 6-carboxytetrahydropterin synthase [Desulfurococcaceae archaeon]
MVKIIIGVENISFDASHYTKGFDRECLNLHGHTYKLSIEVKGDIDPDTGMVIDFSILKKEILSIVKEYDHKIIVSKRDLDKISIKGPFNTEFKIIDYPYATAEYIALDIARRLREKIKLPVRLKLYEGLNNYVIVEID